MSSAGRGRDRASVRHSAMPPESHQPFSLASAASQVGSDGGDDPRFSELLRPIKDLTQNWEVPLARYLEDYISELSDLNLDLARGQKVNFVEAALLLQGTASVYSKKVEFLWQNVLKMLDLLASRKALEASGDQQDKPNRKRKVSFRIYFLKNCA